MSRHSLLEELSPELALVDPELASVAREQLLDPGALAAQRAVSGQQVASPQPDSPVLVPEAPLAMRSDRAVLPPAHPAVRKAPIQRSGRALFHARPLAAFVAFCAIIVVAAVVLKTALPGKHRAPQGAASGRLGDQSSAVVPRGAVTARPRSSSGRVASKGRPHSGGTLEPKRAGVAGVQVTASPPRFPATSPSPPVITWSPVPRASFYWFQLSRIDLPGTRKILDAFPVRARIALHARWVNAARRYRLTPGRYRWYVWPQFGPRDEPRYTKLIVQGKLVVKRAPWLGKR
jgi:hypothetical protein